MHSKKVNIIVGLLAIVACLLLLIVYYQRQGEYTFSFILEFCKL